MTKKNSTVGILGAGISGLSTAYALSQKNINVTVYEKEAVVGGAIKTASINDWLVEEGPNTLMIKSPELWELLDSLGLNDIIVEANNIAKKRYVVKNNRPIPLPLSVSDFLKTSLLSLNAKFRLLKEPFVAKQEQSDESIASFISRRLGSEPLDYAINPFVSGIYAGDPKKLSVKHTFAPLWEMEQEHGSLLKGAIKRDRKNSSIKRSLISFKEGNQTLPKAMAGAISGTIDIETEITSITNKDSHWEVGGNTKGMPFTQTHDVIISTLPAHSLSSIFNISIPDELNELPYAPISVIALGFRSSQIEHPLDGFGMLIPEVEDRRTLGVLFSSTLFPNRVPKDHELLTCFIGGARNPGLASKPKQELQSIIMDEIGELLNISGDPIFTHHRYWKKNIPQYEVGYDQYLKQIEEIEKKHNGLFLDGNFRGGVSVPDCILSGFKTAKKTETFLESLSS
ncbi:protoporphyrinogen oxidase [Aliifodinibius salicampi]|uniref:Coproporphyrinogen III oxidase n=1 Tax=Fodinibius salicampi TaxID=1920655 RepID=A0ABT3PZ76_9BACT|nr:protoporphyrinogen oxidase [Fodinibius salicampi]MCW9713158.1 protoporphyrinogen oxidase [Fodinibius salicampi]